MIDHAPRQFWPDSDVPRMTPHSDLPKVWDARHDITDALDQYLADTARCP